RLVGKGRHQLVEPQEDALLKAHKLFVGANPDTRHLRRIRVRVLGVEVTLKGRRPTAAAAVGRRLVTSRTTPRAAAPAQLAIVGRRSASISASTQARNGGRVARGSARAISPARPVARRRKPED